jgi:hypothetical protein
VGQIPWPSRSPPYLNPLDFFFWEYVKEHVYILPLLRTVNELKELTSKTIASVNGNMLHGTWQEFEYRLEMPCY